MKKIAFFLISSIVVISSVQAQYDAQFSQNMYMLSVHNPAMMSLDGRANALGLFRKQWAGFNDGEPSESSRPKTVIPKTFFFDVSVPFTIGKEKHVVGLMGFKDEAGLFASQNAYLQYAYKRKIWEGTLSGGANLGFMNTSFDGEHVYIPESDYHQNDDPAIPKTNESGFGFDMSLGVSYYDATKYVGLALAHVTAPTIEIGDKATLDIKPMLNITAGYNILLSNALYELKPSIFFKTDFASWQIDLNAIIEYKKMFFGGLSYRYQDAVVVLLGVKVLNGFQLSASYDITTSKLGYSSAGGQGSFEVLGSYSFTLERTKKNKVKSVRIL